MAKNKKKKMTPDEMCAQKTLEQEKQLRKDFERDQKELAPWVGWEEYQDARKSEARLRAVGIIGAYMSGKKREEIRKTYHISPNKLNAILNSSTVTDVLQYSLGHIYSFQTAAVQAILWQLTMNHDGHLAVALLERMGVFKQMDRLTQPQGEEDKGGQADDVIGILLSKGKHVQARQISETLSNLVVEAFKSAPDGE